MGNLILICLVCVAFYIIKTQHIKVKIKTFFRKGFSPNRGQFGVYCFCGKQGQGKTYSVVEFLKENKDKEIYANLKSIKGVNYTYFEGFDELLKLQDKKDCIIVYDEIFTALTKTSRINQDVLSFLSQMRKRKIIFLTTAQEWLEINMTLRRYCRYQIECKMKSIPIIKLGILIKRFYDAELMKWSPNDNEYMAPLLSTTISKCNVSTANMYDTREEIKT